MVVVMTACIAFTVGVLTVVAVVSWFVFSRRSPLVVEEAHWLESSDRWEFVRQQELKRRRVST